MGFVDLSKLSEKYTVGRMRENIEDLIEFDCYHCLLAGGKRSSLEVQSVLGDIPDQFMDWLAICDGGLFFDTVMLSSKEHDDELDLDFDTYEEFNSSEAIANFCLPEGYAVFAFRSYGDPLCFNVNENDGKVYLWNVEKGEFDDIWDSFEDWMTEEVYDAINLIAEDVLEPLEVKIGGEDNE